MRIGGWILAGWLALLASLPPAHAEAPPEAPTAAPPAVRAEQVRLRNEMQKLAGRETWDGVEALYRQILLLEAQGAVPDPEDHLLGAQAARSRGDVAETRARLLLARDGSDAPLIGDWLSDIDANYGRVSVLLPSRYREPRALVPAQVPFEADRRSAIEFAQQQLLESSRFDGYLPSGAYTFDGHALAVAPGAPATLNLQPEASRTRTPPPPSDPPPPRERVERPPAEEREAAGGSVGTGRLRLGVGFGGLSGPSAAQAGLMPAGFGGVSPQLAVGGGLVVAERYLLLVEAGGWGALGAGDSLAVGYGALLGGLRVGGLEVAAGPAYALGRGRLSGLDGDALDAWCLPEISRCSGLSEDFLNTAAFAGRVRAGGGMLLASVPLPAASPGALGYRLGGDIGMLGDGDRRLTWARLSLVVELGGGRAG